MSASRSPGLDDFLIIVMRGGTTVAEQTMLDRDREDLVRQFRQEFRTRWARSSSRWWRGSPAGRWSPTRARSCSTPGLVLEIFVFDEPAGEDEIRAPTAEAQLAEGAHAGEVETEEVAADIPADRERWPKLVVILAASG